jgi:hypothetical protein
MDGEKSVNKALNQTLKLKAAKVEARSPARLHPREQCGQRSSTAGLGDPYSGSMGGSNISAQNIDRDLIKEANPNSESGLEPA